MACGLILSLEGCGKQAAAGTTGASRPPHANPTVSRTTPPPTVTTPVTRTAGQGTPPGPTCAPPNLGITVTAGRVSYRAGERIVLTISVRNDSHAPCDIPTGSCIPQVLISDEAGAVVWNRTTTQGMCTFGAPVHLAPGEITSHTVEWDGRRCRGRTPADCPGTPITPGTYRVMARWQSLHEAATSLRIS